MYRLFHDRPLGGIYEWAGNYRPFNLEKGGIKFPPAMLQGVPNITRLMKEFEMDILRKYTPGPKGYELSKVAGAIAVVHGEFEMIHPFREGNGRAGRLIADLVALQAGYPPLIFDTGGKPQNKVIYFDAMKEVFIHKNYEPLAMIAENAIKMGIKKAKK